MKYRGFSLAEKAATASNETAETWQIQPIRIRPKTPILVTKVKQTNVSYLNNCTNIYINDTIVNYNNNENDTSVKDAENTRGNKPCTNRGKKIRRGGRNMKHVKR